jgi:hypothetical protein
VGEEALDTNCDEQAQILGEKEANQRGIWGTGNSRGSFRVEFGE